MLISEKKAMEGNLSGARALITGLNGFTGRYLAAELGRAGFSVFGADAHPHGLPNCYQADLLDKASLVRMMREVQPSVVVHLAAVAFVGHGCFDDFYQVNLLGTRNLLAVIAENVPEIKCVLLASSANVYGNTPDGVLCEETLPNPANDYAVSKLAMEYMARLWMGRLPIVLVRPFNYTGVGQAANYLLPKIVDHFRRREPVIELGNVDVERDYSDVRFVVQVYERLLQKAPVGEIFNVCSGVAYSLSDVLAMMAEIVGYEIEVRVNPDFVRANDVKRLQGDGRKLERAIGHQPVIPLRTTLVWMLDDVQTH